MFAEIIGQISFYFRSSTLVKAGGGMRGRAARLRWTDEDAERCYRNGVAASFAQWQLSGAESYLGSDAMAADYHDPVSVSLKGIPSASKYQNDTESSDTEGTGLLEAASRQMAVNAYVPLYFSSFLKENESEPSALRYEMEYLLAGKKSDRENLKDAVNQVLTLRGAMNLLFLLNSPDKKAEADALAAAVAVGIVPAQMALSFFILTLWAFGEAVLDVKMLLAGGKIPFWKTEGTWKTCLSGLLDQSFLKETGESSGDGRTYTEYLSCLILLMDRKTRNFWMMDLIQWNIRTEQADFSVANCAYQIEIEAEVLQKHMFFQKEEYKGTVYVAGSY